MGPDTAPLRSSPAPRTVLPMPALPTTPFGQTEPSPNDRGTLNARPLNPSPFPHPPAPAGSCGLRGHLRRLFAPPTFAARLLPTSSSLFLSTMKVRPASPGGTWPAGWCGGSIIHCSAAGCRRTVAPPGAWHRDANCVSCNISGWRFASLWDRGDDCVCAWSMVHHGRFNDVGMFSVSGWRARSLWSGASATRKHPSGKQAAACSEHGRPRAIG
jgi:hypothetical protein